MIKVAKIVAAVVVLASVLCVTATVPTPDEHQKTLASDGDWGQPQFIRRYLLGLQQAPNIPTGRSIVAEDDRRDTLSWVLLDDSTLIVSPKRGEVLIDSVEVYYSPFNGSEGHFATERREPQHWREKSALVARVIIEDGVTSIRESDFRECQRLRKIVIPPSVVEIGDRAFEDCWNLSEVVLPAEGLKKIGENAFDDTALTTIAIPGSVTEIGGNTFYGCDNLVTAVIPPSVKEMPYGMFYQCSNLRSVTIPEGVVAIGRSAFEACRSLAEITLPTTLERLETMCFDACSSLTSITIPEGVTTIEDWALHNSGIKSINIPASVSTIEERAFAGCQSLTRIDVAPQNKHYSSEDGVLFNKKRTVQLCYPEGKPRDRYTIPEGATAIPPNAFRQSDIASAVIPEGVVEIGEGTFSYCRNLVSVIIPEGVTTIGKSAFYGCNSLTTITLPKSLTNLGEYCFAHCTSLAQIVIPEGVQDIESHCFWKSGLHQIAIPASVESIETNAFEGCANLKSIDVAPRNSLLASLGGVLLTKDKRELLLYPPGKPGSNYTIPAGVEIIEASAFSECTQLQFVNIPEGVTTIWKSFFKCSALKRVQIPASVNRIQDPFTECDSLERIDVMADNPDYVSILYTARNRVGNFCVVHQPNPNRGASALRHLCRLPLLRRWGVVPQRL